jgi:hypothetical protein
MKIPLQILILSTGVLVFVLLRLHASADALQPDPRSAGGRQLRASDYSVLQHEFDQAFAERRAAASAENRTGFLEADARMLAIRASAASIVKEASGDVRYSDVNYVFPTFITTHLPMGLVGLMIAAIFAAAMSAASGELTSLTSATIIDFYKRHFVKEATDRHYLYVSRLATTAWGLFACSVAMFAADQGSLIEVVNRYGSLFYGSILSPAGDITKRAMRRGRLLGTDCRDGRAAGRLSDQRRLLWHNLIGAAVVFSSGWRCQSRNRDSVCSNETSPELHLCTRR